MFKPRVCRVCSKVYQPNSGASRVCSKECKAVEKKAYSKKYHAEHYVQKGEYKWEMPKGKDSPFYKDGIGIFTKIAFEHYPRHCNRCGSTNNLCVHHKNRNRRDNRVDNLEILCKSCHQKEHNAGEHFKTEHARQRSSEAASAYQLAHPKPRDAKGRFTTIKV